MYNIIHLQGDSGMVIDSEKNRDDALLLAMLYTERHFERIMPDRGQMIGAILAGRDEISGYRFVTNNGTLVSYEIRKVH